MGPFSTAVFSSKKLFTDDIIKQFGDLQTDNERLQFINGVIPNDYNCVIAEDEDNNNKSVVDTEEVSIMKNNKTDNVKKSNIESLFVRMSHHSKFPALSSATKIQYGEDSGRFLVADRYIRRGETVAVEKPCIAFPLIHEDFLFCNQCFLRLTSGLECRECGDVSWCSEDCRKEALASHHRWECGMKLAAMVRREHAGLGKLFLVLRTFTQKTVGYFRENAEQLRGYKPAEGSAHSGDTHSDLCDEYRALFNLTRHFTNLSVNQILEVAIVAVIMVRTLAAAGYFGEGPEGSGEALSEDELLVGELMMSLVLIVNVNTHPLNEALPDSTEERIAAAIYPTVASVLNHSCHPNLIRANAGNCLVLVAAKDIEEGEELTDMYTVHWAHWGREERRKYLQDTFRFWCQCCACRENWPVIDDGEVNPQTETGLAHKKRKEEYENRTKLEAVLLHRLATTVRDV